VVILPTIYKSVHGWNDLLEKTVALVGCGSVKDNHCGIPASLEILHTLACGLC